MPVQRILIIKHGALGDVVLAMGTMKRLRELHPEAHITLMTMGMFVPMAEQLGVFDDFIVDNRLPYWKLGATWRAVRSIVKGNFDVVYDLQESSRTRKRYYPAVRFLLGHDMDWVACNSGERRKFIKKKPFRRGKVERLPFRLERVLTDLSFMHGEGLHFDELPERYVMMIPGCSPNHPYKRWPVENFCALAKRLAARGVSSVVIGTRAEAAEVEAIAASSPLAVSFLGKSSLMDIPQMALRSLACVGNDTGPTHMCAYAGVPVTAIFCHRTRNSAITARCISNLISPGAIEEITVDQVWSALEPFLPPQEGLEQIRAAGSPLPYLAQCLESICSQTFRELEVVCVDDASTDGSLSILREFAERDPRVKVVQAPENGGLSRSRNLAMNHAVGEYLFLVDSDDWLETDLLEEMYSRAKALDADKLVCGFRYYYEADPDREDRFLPEDMAPPEKGWIPCTPETIGKIHHGAGGMMIRRSIVEKHGIRFPEGVACEDLYFHYAVFPWCRRVCVVSRAAYVYRKRAGSITGGFASGSSLQSLDYLTVAELVLKEWKEAGILAQYRTAFLKMLVMGVRNIRKYAPHAVQKEVTRKVADMLRQENLYRPGEDDSSLSRREGKLLQTWMGGKSGLDFSYYWKKMRKAGARLLRR